MQMERFEVFMVVKIHTVVFCIMTLCGLAAEYSILKEHKASTFKAKDGDIMLPQNVDIDIPDCARLLYKLMMPVTSVVCLLQ
jgi:hypothetical protein